MSYLYSLNVIANQQLYLAFRKDVKPTMGWIAVSRVKNHNGAVVMK